MSGNTASSPKKRHVHESYTRCVLLQYSDVQRNSGCCCPTRLLQELGVLTYKHTMIRYPAPYHMQRAYEWYTA
jgi:hypothetical protein